MHNRSQLRPLKNGSLNCWDKPFHSFADTCLNYILLLTYPNWPDSVAFFLAGLDKLVDIWYPLEAVAEDEDRNDDKPDL